MSEIFKKLFIFEMANNHMGDVNHGLKIIRELAIIKENFDFNFAFKFQFRDLDSFIHPSFKNRKDLKYIKRFQETSLSKSEFKILKNEVDSLGFKSMCTPFDEKSVDLINELNFDVIKIASCSFTDWPLLEKIATTNKPVIASTAGATLSDIDKVVHFFTAGNDKRLFKEEVDTYRNKKFAIMHCVGEYPTKIENLQLNQISLLKKRYPNITVGFSTHEDPDETDAIKLAIGKGAEIFERHVAVDTSEYKKNDYSATPEQIRHWLDVATTAIKICGEENVRPKSSHKELSDLLQFKRGVYATRDIKIGEEINEGDFYYAFPNQPNQLLANDISNTVKYESKREIKKSEPIYIPDVVQNLKTEEAILNLIIEEVKDMLLESGVAYPGKASFEISHHYGINKIRDFGTIMVTVVNREYCKKLIIVLPGQKHPEQYHVKKEETFNVLSGKLELSLDGKISTLEKGDVSVIERGVRHSFSSKDGAIIEELSTTHFKEDSYYTDEKIMKNQERKTIILQ